MPRAKIDPHWQRRIKTLFENDKLTPPRIHARLLQEAKRTGRTVPDEKTVRNYVKPFRDAPEEVRRQYRYVWWPESFGQPDLPWESAPVVMELIRESGDDERLTIATASWFWRVTVAAPALPFAERRVFARLLAATEATGVGSGLQTRRDIEWRLLNPDKPLPRAFSIAASPEALAEVGYLTKSEAETLREIQEESRPRRRAARQQTGEINGNQS